VARLGLSSIAVDTQEWIAFSKAAEVAGLHSIWGADAWWRDCFVNAAYALMATKEIRVGVSIAMPTRSPLVTVKCAQNLSELGQRFTLGLGPGHSDAEVENPIGAAMLKLTGPFTNHQGHGVPHSPAIGRMRDYLDCISTALRAPAGEVIDKQGKYFRIGALGAGLDAEALPIILGGVGPKMVNLAATQADGVVTHMMAPRKLIASRLADAAAVRDGKPFFSASGAVASIHEDERIALRLARAELIAALHTEHYQNRLQWLAGDDLTEKVLAELAAGRIEQAAELLPEEVVREFVLVTTPSRFADDVEAFDVADVLLPLSVGNYFIAIPGIMDTKPEDAQRAREALVQCSFGSALKAVA
jgi:alkanesulfonate monooxygenase SsuD/methylene tetrahydromethanopterin reductase-like flavin-dependent oxidoreductase (luciferase family)